MKLLHKSLRNVLQKQDLLCVNQKRKALGIGVFKQ